MYVCSNHVLISLKWTLKSERARKRGEVAVVVKQGWCCFDSDKAPVSCSAVSSRGSRPGNPLKHSFDAHLASPPTGSVVFFSAPFGFADSFYPFVKCLWNCQPVHFPQLLPSALLFESPSTYTLALSLTNAWSSTFSLLRVFVF